VLTLADGRKKTARTFKFFGRGHPRHGWTVAPAGGPRSVCGRSLLERAMAQTRNKSTRRREGTYNRTWLYRFALQRKRWQLFECGCLAGRQRRHLSLSFGRRVSDRASAT